MTDISGTSTTPQETLKDQLKQLMPEVFSEEKIDWERLQAALGESINFSNERYVLNWAGKSDAFRVLQAPTSQTLVPAKDESVNFDKTGHIFVEGENLQVLKVLQKSYFGKVKMIYIDPPYNTGNDSFIYPDRFAETKEEYQKRVGDKDETGYMTREGIFRANSKENGQYHSNWLNMMYPRLYLAKNLLRDDGVIFLSIDDNEVHNLRMLMNEVFGEENFVASIIWQKKYAVSNDDEGIGDMHDYVLCYRKSDQFKRSLLPRTEKQLKRYKNPDNDPRGPWSSAEYVSGKSKVERPTLWYPVTHPKTGKEVWPDESAVWRYSREKHEKMVKEDRLYWGPGQAYEKPRLKRFLSEIQSGLVPNTWWEFKEVGHNDEGQKETAKLMGKKVFSTPKPTRLIEKMLKIGTDKSDIVLDFFSGSGTLGHAVLNTNNEDNGDRKFICVQLPENCDPNSEAYKAGYKTIADIAKERIRRVINNIKKEQDGKLDFDQLNPDLGFKVFKLKNSNFKQWQETNIKDLDDLQNQLEIFTNSLTGSSSVENIVYELLLKSGKDLNSKIEKKGGYYLIDDGELVFMLEDANEKVIKSIVDQHPKKVLALDVIFNEQDQLKTNTVLQMKDAGIEFKTF